MFPGYKKTERISKILLLYICVWFWYLWCVCVCLWRVCEVGRWVCVKIATDLDGPVKLQCFFARASEVMNFLPPCRYMIFLKLNFQNLIFVTRVFIPSIHSPCMFLHMISLLSNSRYRILQDYQLA